MSKKPKKPVKAKIKGKKPAARKTAPMAKAKAKAKPDEGLFVKLDGMIGDKSPAMLAIYRRLAEMRGVIDVAIAEAEGELKAVLQLLRRFLF